MIPVTSQSANRLFMSSCTTSFRCKGKYGSGKNYTVVFICT